MLTLLHISDLHFGPPFLPDVGEALLRAANSLGPDIVVASGDFTQRAKAPQFADARAFLDRLPRVPLVVVPGNHDVPLYRVFERLFTPYLQYKRYISAQLDTVLRHEGAVIVALNSAAQRTAIVNGRIDRWQLDLCREAFQDVPPGQARIVVVHHHLAPAPDYDNEHDMLRGARRALNVFTECRVDLILGGHLHRAYIGNSLDVYPGTDRTSGIVIVQSGTTTSARGRAREREKNSFNLIHVDEAVIRVTHYMFFHDLGEFAPLSRHVFARRDRRYLAGPD
jgi:3',5'-cyclic AMP phosphodiesterase CpdA